MTTAAAYAACRAVARSHYENFPVASWLLPRAARAPVSAIYAFARLADDFADEGRRPPDERLALLEDWQRRLDAAAVGRLIPAADPVHEAVFVAIADTLGALGDSGHQLLSDLLSAFRQDVTTCRYETWDELLDYCRRSANPVGRLVLMVTGHRDTALFGASDHVCTALQLTNFWQDLAIDHLRGRLYVPMEVVRQHGANLDDLDSRRWSIPWQRALAGVGERTRSHLLAGRAVVDGVQGRLRWELRMTWLGGLRILDRLDETDYDVFAERPTLTRRDVPGLLWNALHWR